MDKASADQLLERHFRQAFDIHGVPGGKLREGPDFLCRTVRVFTDQCLRAQGIMDLRLHAAGRTVIRNHDMPGTCQVLRNLRNNHVRLVDTDPVPGSQLQRAHDADIVYACSGYRGAFQLHRFKDSHRVDQSCSGRAPLNLKQAGDRLLILPLERHCISRRLGSIP